ncbi:MAG: leucyl aminopeptidase family protein [Rhodocyclaceae bacterium]|nr:MAG: leucyl aminopeptidase family protein [Rhodocyclaceae bacterium]
MPIATLNCHGFVPETKDSSHQLWLLPAGKELPAKLPALAQWRAVLARRDAKVTDLAKTPQALDLPDGGRMVLVQVDSSKPRFERLTALRKAVMLLLEETPKNLTLVNGGVDPAVAQDAVYAALVNGAALPARKKKAAKALSTLNYHGPGTARDFAAAVALADGNTLARSLTALPPNELTPADYRKRIRTLAKDRGWHVEEFDFKKLKKMGAGAFCAVAQGSDHEDAAIVHLRYAPKGAKQTVALVGKGICFDTGGHNLKPARYMQGMHEDMNGSAVVLGLFQAISDLKLPVVVDAWLAIAHNHISPRAFMQNDIVTALDGTTIEVVHTDAEGRMVLADTLTLAAKKKPDLMIDFATLTGSMHTALGNRYSGVFASEEALALLAVTAGRASGERVCVFPMDEDYEAGLDSKVADIKQCTMEGEADHILAARFLKRFTAKRPWLHMDLSASGNEGGLGAVSSNLTGFGVAWGLHLIQDWSR